MNLILFKNRLQIRIQKPTTCVIKTNKLTRQEKEAMGLLSIGTFLEYFDLMLYVHMAILLNELFFPQADPFTAKLLGAAAFCSVFKLKMPFIISLKYT